LKSQQISSNLPRVGCIDRAAEKEELMNDKVVFVILDAFADWEYAPLDAISVRGLRPLKLPCS
jgi:hypothetical protein